MRCDGRDGDVEKVEKVEKVEVNVTIVLVLAY
jgi:hypothetical protein